MRSYFLTFIIYAFVDFIWTFVSTGVAKEDMAFKNVTPTICRGQGRPSSIFVCLVRHGKCPTYQSKQILKRHLIEVHNVDFVEVG